MKTRRVKYHISGLLLALLFIPPAQAQQAPVATTTHHSLWKVQGKSNAVYLLGSIHVLKKENYPLPQVMEAAFTNAAIAAFETDIGAMEQPDTQQKVLSKAQLPESETLQRQLSPGVYNSFTNHLQEAGLPVEIFEQFKPSVAAITLAALEMRKQGLDPEYGLDKHFFDRAGKEGKQIAELETLDFQIGLVTDFSKEEGELLVKTTLKDLDKLKTELGSMVKAWQTGDADSLEKLLNEASREAPVIYKRLLTDRNQRWLPKIEEWLRGDKNVVVIVGAGHLVGSEGVVELLRKKGWKVIQQ
ncbi:MAG TPA: TraB/GumN family protein [Candidatus Binatia bacterium]|jgi:uncharacterized protein YbaP (TraB family)|nr:TraB/GumN family protein [Candidatus Binatia bacterium]